MTPVNKLLDTAKETCSPATDMALADALHVVRSAVSNWRNGRAYPDEVACARLATMTNQPLARVLGIVGEARARSAAAKQVWRSLARTAAGIALAYSVGWTGTARASGGLDHQTTTHNSVYYVPRRGHTRRRHARPKPLISRAA